MITKFLAAAVLACSALASAPALAHGGAAPKHGGVVQAASDLSFELVAGEGAAMVYVEDHGKPMVPAGMSGKLTVLNGTEKSEAVLVPAGEGRLETKGIFKVAAGTKVVALVTLPGKKAANVRFAVK